MNKKIETVAKDLEQRARLLLQEIYPDDETRRSLIDPSKQHRLREYNDLIRLHDLYDDLMGFVDRLRAANRDPVAKRARR